MGIATRTPSCRNTSGFGCLYLRSARASGLFPLWQQNKDGARAVPPARDTAAPLSPHGPQHGATSPARAAHRDASGAEKRSAPCRPWPRPRPRQRSREPDGCDAWGGGVKGRAVAAAVPLSPRRRQTRRSPARSRLAVRAQPGLHVRRPGDAQLPPGPWRGRIPTTTRLPRGRRAAAAGPL